MCLGIEYSSSSKYCVENVNNLRPVGQSNTRLRVGHVNRWADLPFSSHFNNSFRLGCMKREPNLCVVMPAQAFLGPRVLKEKVRFSAEILGGADPPRNCVLRLHKTVIELGHETDSHSAGYSIPIRIDQFTFVRVNSFFDTGGRIVYATGQSGIFSRYLTKC